ncbi:MAG: DUF5317 family protein [Streptosporangiaceae bacterium]
MIGAYLVGLGFAVALGWLIGGRLAGIARLRMRSLWLLWLALALQLSQYVPAFRLGPAGAGHRVLLVVSYGSVALWLLRNVAAQRNRGLRIGLAVVGLGWALNAAVVVVNNGMPVSRAATQRAGAPAAFTDSALERGDLYKHVLSTSATHLRPLGDVIPVPLLHGVVSPGDVVLWLGILITVIAAMCFVGVRKGSITGRLLVHPFRVELWIGRASKRNNSAG